jgi:hypothetical protein
VYTYERDHFGKKWPLANCAGYSGATFKAKYKHEKWQHNCDKNINDFALVGDTWTASNNYKGNFVMKRIY